MCAGANSGCWVLRAFFPIFKEQPGLTTRIRPIFRSILILAASCATAFSQVVISQVYGGGGATTGTPTFHDDYVELFNRGAATATIGGWSIQYGSASGTGSWSVYSVPANTSIQPGHYLLVQLTQTGSTVIGSMISPAADLSSASLSLSASAGKVALVNTTTALSGACPTSSAIQDLLGYGSANCSEGTAASALTNILAAFRAGGGCTDTNANNSDFSSATPAPRNSSSTANTCIVSLGGTGSASPASVAAGSSSTLTASITPAANSTGIAVSCNLTGIGGSATFSLPVSSGNTYSASYTVPAATAAQAYSLPCSVTDAQSHSASFNIALTVTGSSTPPTATGSASPNPVTAGNSVSLSATPVSGSNPASTSYTSVCSLALIGGGSSVTLPASYTVPAATSATTYSLPCTVTDNVSRSSSFSIGLTVQAPPPTTHLISEINGSGTTSPLAGTSVTTRGVVTAIRGTTGTTQGFYLESVTADRDNDPNTSEGLLVFTGSTAVPSCAVVGNNIQIQGTVSDFVPSTAPVGTVPLTELASTSNCQVLGTNALGSLPAAVTIDSTVVAAGGSATQSRKFLGMRVSIPNAVAVGPSLGNLDEPSAQATPSGQFFVTVQGVSRPFHTAPGIQGTRRPSDAASTVPTWNGNPEAFRVDTTGLTGGSTFEVATGTTFTGLTGIMDYNTSQSQYQIYTNTAGVGTRSPSSPTLSATAIPTPLATDLLIVNANIERFFNDLNDSNGNSVLLTSAAYQGRLNKLSLGIRNVLHMPDIITMEELEGPGPTDPANYPVPQDIVNKINADAAAAGQGSPNYNWCEYPTNDPSQISVAVLYRRDRVSLIDCTQFGLATTYATPGGGSSLLNDRPPVTLRATVKADGSDSGLQVRVVVNHLRSLGSIDQPGSANGERVRTKRNEQAIYLAKLITGNLSEQSTNWNLTDNLLVAGDMNAFDVSDGYADSVNCIAGSPAPANQLYLTALQLTVTTPCSAISTLALTNLTTTDTAQRYSYSFSGAAQRIDHILVNGKLNARVRQFAYARNNADFPEGSTYRNDFTRPERYSDHDAPAVYIRLPLEVTSRTRVNASPLVLNRATGRSNGTVTVTNTGSTSLTGPVYVFFNGLPAGVTLPDLPQSNGVPYATINLPSGLAPGATSPAVTISFANPANARIGYTTQRYDVQF